MLKKEDLILKTKKFEEDYELILKMRETKSAPVDKMGLKKLWNIVPLFIKFMSLSTLTLCILNLFLKNISYLLSNIPLNTIFHIQIWRLFSSALTSLFAV